MLRQPLWAVVTAGILEVTHQLLLFGISRKGRVAGGTKLFNLLLDVRELGAPIRMVIAFVRFPMDLTPEANTFE
jgi:hypothetical protein